MAGDASTDPVLRHSVAFGRPDLNCLLSTPRARPEEDLIDYAPGKMNPGKDIRLVYIGRASFQPGIAFEVQEI